MTRTAVAIAAGIYLLAPGRATPAPDDRSARAIALDALAEKADLPLARPALPSLLAERESLRPEDTGDNGKGAKAAGEVRGAARSEAAKASAAAARSEAARAARSAKEDARGKAEKEREEKTRKKPKPPRPGGGSP